MNLDRHVLATVLGVISIQSGIAFPQSKEIVLPQDWFGEYLIVEPISGSKSTDELGFKKRSQEFLKAIRFEMTLLPKGILVWKTYGLESTPRRQDGIWELDKSKKTIKLTLLPLIPRAKPHQSPAGVPDQKGGSTTPTKSEPIRLIGVLDQKKLQLDLERVGNSTSDKIAPKVAFRFTPRKAQLPVPKGKLQP